MKFLIITIFVLFAAAKAEKTPRITLGIDRGDGFFMLGFAMKKTVEPFLEINKLIKEVFPEVEAGMKANVQGPDKCLQKINLMNATVCVAAMGHVCLVPIMEYYEKHLPENSKGIPQMMRDGHAAATQYVCNSRTEEFFELSNDCLSRKIAPEQTAQITKMYEEFSKTFKATPTKDNLCRGINGLRSLLETSVKSICQSDVTVAASMALYDAVAKPCNNV